LNLAIVYLRTKRDAELGALLERINPESLPSHSHSLRAAAYYVQGLQAFFGARYNEAKYVRFHVHSCIDIKNKRKSKRLGINAIFKIYALL